MSAYVQSQLVQVSFETGVFYQSGVFIRSESQVLLEINKKLLEFTYTRLDKLANIGVASSPRGIRRFPRLVVTFDDAGVRLAPDRKTFAPVWVP